MSNTSYKEDFIEKLYTNIGIFLPHQLDLKEIAYRLNIHLYYWTNPSQALFFNGQSYIFLEEGLTAQQLWQDFCHELCHVLFHSGSQERMPYSWIEYQEWKANSFVLHACVPTFMLKKMIIPLGLKRGVQFICDHFNVDEEIAYKRLQHFSENHSDERYVLLERSL